MRRHPSMHGGLPQRSCTALAICRCCATWARTRLQQRRQRLLLWHLPRSSMSSLQLRRSWQQIAPCQRFGITDLTLAAYRVLDPVTNAQCRECDREKLIMREAMLAGQRWQVPVVNVATHSRRSDLAHDA